jgi:hypothetical protein
MRPDTGARFNILLSTKTEISNEIMDKNVTQTLHFLAMKEVIPYLI